MINLYFNYKIQLHHNMIHRILFGMIYVFFDLNDLISKYKVLNCLLFFLHFKELYFVQIHCFLIMNVSYSITKC